MQRTNEPDLFLSFFFFFSTLSLAPCQQSPFPLSLLCYLMSLSVSFIWWWRWVWKKRGGGRGEVSIGKKVVRFPQELAMNTKQQVLKVLSRITASVTHTHTHCSWLFPLSEYCQQKLDNFEYFLRHFLTSTFLCQFALFNSKYWSNCPNSVIFHTYSILLFPFFSRLGSRISLVKKKS